MKFTTEQILAMQRRTDGNQRQWLTTWEELAYYYAPQRVGFLHKRSAGEKKTERVYDSTAMTVSDDLTHYLSSALTPSAYPWARVAFRDKGLKKNREASRWLEGCIDKLFIALGESNFYEEVGEFFRDACTFGTGSIGCREKKDFYGEYEGLHFEWMHMREITGVVGQYGRLDVTLRTHTDTARAWYEKFGDACGESIMAIVHNDPGREFKFVHCVYPRDPDEIDPRAADMPDDISDDRMPWASVWISLRDRQCVKESGYLEEPRIVVPWDKNADNVFGHGPGLRALPDVRSLNEATRLEFEAWEKSIDPPLKTTSNNVVTNLNRSAGGLTAVKRYDELGPLYEQTKWELTMLKREELVQAIRDVFYSDLIAEPGAKQSAQTAYEVARKMERAQRILGEAIAHLRSRAMDWVIERAFGLMLRNDQFDEMPDSLMEEDSKLDIQFVSQLAISQQSAALENTLAFMGDLMQIAQVISPQNPMEAPVMEKVDWDALVEELHDRRNVSSNILKTDDEVEDARDEKAEAQQRAESLEATKVASKAVADVGAGAGPEAAQKVIDDAESQRLQAVG